MLGAWFIAPGCPPSSPIGPPPGGSLWLMSPPPPPSPPPPASPPVSASGASPIFFFGATATTAIYTDFPSGGDARAFRLLVPKSYDGSKPFPLVFGWHWLNASSASFITDGELDTAAEQMQFIAVLPDNL